MFDFQQISRYRENNRLEAKAGHRRAAQEHLGDLFRLCQHLRWRHPAGGGGAARPHPAGAGLLEPRELVDEFTALLQNPRVVSANLLTPGDIQVLHVDGGDIVAITVPPAEQDQRPVYIGGDLARGSYRRSGDGDYHCTRAELNAMLGGRSH